MDWAIKILFAVIAVILGAGFFMFYLFFWLYNLFVICNDAKDIK